LQQRKQLITRKKRITATPPAQEGAAGEGGHEAGKESHEPLRKVGGKYGEERDARCQRQEVSRGLAVPPEARLQVTKQKRTQEGNRSYVHQGEICKGRAQTRERTSSVGKRRATNARDFPGSERYSTWVKRRESAGALIKVGGTGRRVAQY